MLCNIQYGTNAGLLFVISGYPVTSYVVLGRFAPVMSVWAGVVKACSLVGFSRGWVTRECVYMWSG